jgi:hypothetical protein
VSTCIEANGVEMSAPVINHIAQSCIHCNLFKAAGVAVINVSQPHCRTGFICGIQYRS